MSDEAIDRILSRDARYERAAYEFVLEAIRRASGSGHVTAEQLLEQIRRLAIESFGLLAATVLGYWRVHTTEDFGNIVFSLVAEEAVGKTDDDELAHFVDVFDFADAFPDETGPVAIHRPPRGDVDDG